MQSAARSAQRIFCASFFRSAASSAEWPMINSAVVVMNSEPKTLSHAQTFVMEGRPQCRPRLLRTGQSPSLQRLVHARMMKQILLCVTAMVAEVLLCERQAAGGVQSSRPRKILLAQDPFDPDVDWERA